MLDPSSTTQYLTAENGHLVLHNPNPDFSGPTNASFMVWLCGSQGNQPANVNGYTLTVKMEILNTLNDVSPPNEIRIVGNNGKFIVAQDLTNPAGYQWITLSGTLTADSSMVGILLSLTDTLTGTVLVDEVTLTPP